MASSYEIGGDGGRRSDAFPQSRADAPKARFPSDPVYEKPADERASAAPALGDTARSATDALRRQASQFADDVGNELSRTGETQKARGVDALHKVARAIDDAAKDLQDQSPIVARTVREAARQVDGLSETLSSRNVNDLVDQTLRLARRQPILFVGGSVAVGFVLARFLMTSGARRASGQSAGYGERRYGDAGAPRPSTRYVEEPDAEGEEDPGSVSIGD